MRHFSVSQVSSLLMCPIPSQQNLALTPRISCRKCLLLAAHELRQLGLNLRTALSLPIHYKPHYKASAVLGTTFYRVSKLGTLEGRHSLLCYWGYMDPSPKFLSSRSSLNPKPFSVLTNSSHTSLCSVIKHLVLAFCFSPKPPQWVHRRIGRTVRMAIHELSRAWEPLLCLSKHPNWRPFGLQLQPREIWKGSRPL